jgi:phage nucleotide-binding protein
MATLTKRTGLPPKTLGTNSPPKNNSKFGDIAKKIKPVNEMSLVIAALFYGRAGTGKTTLASTFPGPLLHLDIREKGTDSISDVEGIDSISVDSWDEFEQVYWYLKANPDKYKSVVIDAVSQLQDYAVEAAVAETGKNNDVVSKREWGIAAGKLKTWIINYRDLVDLGIMVVFLAHDRSRDEAEGEDGELMPSIGPRVMPSVASVLTASVKLIGNTFIKEVNHKQGNGTVKREVVYCIRIGPHAYYDTKIRQPKGSYVPDILENPNYDALVSLMKGEIKAPPPPPAPAAPSKKILRKK